jgi:hypothetical protein
MTEDPLKTIQAKADEFYMFIGQCINDWANIDEILFQIFHHCVGPRLQSAIIYYRTPGLDARLSLTDEIVRSVLPKKKRPNGGHSHEAVRAWGAAQKGFKEALSIRRRIAHQPMAGNLNPFWRQEDGEGDISFLIYANSHEELRKGASQPLELKDLKKHLVDVAILNDQLFQFLHSTLKKQPPSRFLPDLQQP